MQVRRATMADIKRYSTLKGALPSMKAWAGEVDGEVVAVAGFALCEGRWLVFCDLDEKARPYKMTIMRTAIRAMKELREQGARYAYVEMDPDEPRSIAWLVSLGFKPCPRSGGNVFRWSA